jgi:hypothetical protein
VATWILQKLGRRAVDSLSYWGFDAADRLIELVTDFEVLVGPISERLELPLPLPRGVLVGVEPLAPL